MDKIGVKFTNKKPLRGIEKRPIMPSATAKEIEVTYTQATKVCKVSGDTAIKNKAGEYVVVGTDMAGNLPTVVEAISNEKDSESEEPSPKQPTDPDPKPESDPSPEHPPESEPGTEPAENVNQGDQDLIL